MYRNVYIIILQRMRFEGLTVIMQRHLILDHNWTEKLQNLKPFRYILIFYFLSYLYLIAYDVEFYKI